MQLTVKDVAGLLNISEKTVYRWIDEQKLPVYRLNGQYRFHRAELMEWATVHRINVSPAIFKEPENQAIPLPELSEALEVGGIFYRLTAHDKATALRNIVAMLRLPDRVDRKFLLQVLLAREALESTAIGDGIAIPHVRNPIVLHVPQPVVTLCFLDAPVDFGALDGAPVHTLFTVISPAVKAHLHLLSRLTFALRNQRFRSVILRQASREEILSAARQIENNMGPARMKASQDSSNDTVVGPRQGERFRLAEFTRICDQDFWRDSFMNELLQNLLKLQALEFEEIEDKNAEATITDLRSKIPPQILGHYDRLVARGKKGVAMVRDHVCTGCHMRLPIGVITTLMHGTDIQLCDTCGRYLCLANPAPAETPEPPPTAKPKAAKKKRRTKGTVGAA